MKTCYRPLLALLPCSMCKAGMTCTSRLNLSDLLTSWHFQQAVLSTQQVGLSGTPACKTPTQLQWQVRKSEKIPWSGSFKYCTALVITSLQTLLRRKAIGEKGPATELEPGTYTLSWNFSHELLVPVTNPSPTSPYVLYCSCMHTYIYTYVYYMNLPCIINRITGTVSSILNVLSLQAAYTDMKAYWWRLLQEVETSNWVQYIHILYQSLNIS